MALESYSQSGTNVNRDKWTVEDYIEELIYLKDIVEFENVDNRIDELTKEMETRFPNNVTQTSRICIVSDDMTMLEKIDTLIELATQYAKSKSLDINQYVDSMLAFQDDRDPEPIVDILIRYHRDWLGLK